MHWKAFQKRQKLCRIVHLHANRSMRYCLPVERGKRKTRRRGKRQRTLTNEYRENLALDYSCTATLTSKASRDCQPDEKAQRHDIPTFV